MADLTFTAPISTGGVFPAIRKNQVENSAVFTGYANLAALSGIDTFLLTNPGAWAYTTDGYLYQLTSVSPITWTLFTSTLPAGFTAGGDLSGTSSSQNVINIHGASVPIAGSLTTGNGLYVTGASALSYSALNLAGGANYVTGVLPTANQASQTMAGDVTGTTAASVVAKANGATIPAAGSLTTGNGLRVSGSSALTYSALDLAGGSGYVTGVLPVANLPDATTSAKGIVQLAGDLNGTAAAPKVASLTGIASSAASGIIRMPSNNAYLNFLSGDGATTYAGISCTYTSFDELRIGRAYTAGVATAPTTRIQGGSGVTISTDSLTMLDIRGASIDVGSSGFSFLEAVSGFIAIKTRTGNNATVQLRFAGQNASGTATSTNKDGGTVAIIGGIPTDSAGRRRPLTVYDRNSGGSIFFELCDVRQNQTSFAAAFFKAGDITSTEVPDGDRLITIGPVVTEPVANPGSNFAHLYTRAGMLYSRSSTGNNQSIIPSLVVKAFPSDADYTLTQDGYQATIVEFTGGTTLTATRNVIVPTVAGYQWTIYNNTTGGQSIVIKTSGGTGITIATTKRAIVYVDGTNVVRVTADT